MALRENPGVSVLLNVLPEDLLPRAIDADVLLENRLLRLRPIWAGEGFPLDARRALAVAADLDSDVVPVVAARRMSPGAQRLLADRKTSWVDAAGYAEIRGAGLYISRRRPVAVPTRVVRGLSWSPSVEVVTEFVLSRCAQLPAGLEKMWNGVDRVAHIAEAVGISNGQVAKVLLMLDDEGYTAKVGPERGPNSARELRDISRLMSDWAGHYVRTLRPAPKAELHVPWRDPADWISVVREQLGGTGWAVSGWIAADVLAPFATNLPDMILYVPDSRFAEASARLSENIDVTEVDRGGRIHLRAVGKSVLDFADAQGNFPVVSPVRIYADLLKAGGRGAEAAEHLRELTLGF